MYNAGFWSFNGEAFWIRSVWFGLPGEAGWSWWLLRKENSGNVENNGMLAGVTHGHLYVSSLFLWLACASPFSAS